MSHRKHSTAQHKLVLLARVLLVAALLVSIYLGWVSFGGSAVGGCGPESNCDKVLSSRWSLLVPAAWAVIGAVAWFVALQLFVIKAVCPFCMAAHVCGLAAAAILLSL